MVIGKDKILHLLAGFFITLFIGLYSPILGLTAAVVIGAAKELVWDKWMGKGNCELLDFLYTAVGGLLGYVFIQLIRLWF